VAQRIKGFDGLRALAVGMVIVNHKSELGNAISPGGYGVHLFFILSGFLIIRIIHDRRLALEAGTSNLRGELIHFYENRLYRIWPIYYLTAAIVIGLGVIGFWPRLSATETFAILTFTTNIFQGYFWESYPVHFGPLWSVAVEEQFYLWAAPVFLLTRASSHRLICVAVIALAIVVAALTVPLGLNVRSIYVGPLTNFGLMALGGIAAIAMKPSARMAAWAAPALILFCLSPLVAWWIGRLSLAGNLLFWAASLLVVVTLLGIVADQSSRLTRALSLPPLEYIGRISYGLYLYHSLIVLSEWGMPPSRWTTLAEVTLSVAAAAASWRWIEQPLLNLRDRRRSAGATRRFVS
jgi:peptidoglycan/LPS O-acetylase OafA/YrhL